MYSFLTQETPASKVMDDEKIINKVGKSPELNATSQRLV